MSNTGDSLADTYRMITRNNYLLEMTSTDAIDAKGHVLYVVALCSGIFVGRNG